MVSESVKPERRVHKKYREAMMKEKEPLKCRLLPTNLKDPIAAIKKG